MADQGVYGLADFVGFSVGQPEGLPLPAVPVGFLGFLDFTGLPVGAGIPTRVGGAWAAGRLYHAVQAARFNEHLEALARRRTALLVEQIAGRWASFQEAKRRSQEAAMYALLLSEI